MALRRLKNALARLLLNNDDQSNLDIAKQQLEEIDSLLSFFSKSENLATKSHAQLSQDIIALLHTNFKSGGFFVEFGATDGKQLSNTYLLEKQYNWNGILAEPSPAWHQALAANRDCIIDNRCVWINTGETVSFCEAEIGTLSTIEQFKDSDKHSNDRIGKSIDVQTVSLNDLLEQHNAPKHIDYLSIDTEGSEYEILSNFDFSRHSFSMISCEHNFTENREKIHSLMASNGFERKYTALSKFDDWYFGKAYT
jgi:FkbM family methyltransferase